MLSAWAGAHVIAVDTKAAKFDACRAAGATEIIDATSEDVVAALLTLTNGDGVDIAIDYVSAKTSLEQAMSALAVKGRMVTLGGDGAVFEVDAKELLAKELDVLGSRYVTYTDIIESLKLVARGEIWPVVSEIRPLNDGETIHELVERGDIIGRAALLIA